MSKEYTLADFTDIFDYSTGWFSDSSICSLFYQIFKRFPSMKMVKYKVNQDFLKEIKELYQQDDAFDIFEHVYCNHFENEKEDCCTFGVGADRRDAAVRLRGRRQGVEPCHGVRRYIGYILCLWRRGGAGIEREGRRSFHLCSVDGRFGGQYPSDREERGRYRHRAERRYELCL